MTSNLREIRLETAVEGPGFHVFRDKSLLPEYVQIEAFSGWTKVLVNFFVVLWV